MSAAPQGYGSGGAGSSLGGGFGGGLGGPGLPAGGCRDGEVLNIDGTCAVPRVTQQVYVYAAPHQPVQRGPPPKIPTPVINRSVLFIRAPEQPTPLDPVVLPSPEQKNIVYVLHKNPVNQGQRVIQAPVPPQSQPEVYFVNYNDGENPILPGGGDLQSALNSAVSAGGVSTAGGDIFGSGGGFGFDNFSGGVGHGPLLGGGGDIVPSGLYSAP